MVVHASRISLDDDDDGFNLAALVASGTVARLTLAAIGRQMRASGADPDDVVQAVVLRLVEAQRSPRSRYDPSRGMSPTTYVGMVARTAGLNALRGPTRVKERETPIDDHEELVGHEEPGTETSAMARILLLLDTEEERTMAMHLAAGSTISEVRTAMGLTEGEAAELQTRVRALLLPLRDG